MLTDERRSARQHTLEQHRCSSTALRATLPAALPEPQSSHSNLAPRLRPARRTVAGVRCIFVADVTSSPMPAASRWRLIGWGTHFGRIQGDSRTHRELEQRPS
eukprot:scaffold35035_cov71-Phaeocystis_antarctica.AAC.1